MSESFSIGPFGAGMKYPVAIMAIVSVLAGCALTGSGAPQIKPVSINGTRLTYQEQGQGRPVVFVHGAITD